MKQYVVREGVAPVPGIGPGPLPEGEYERREARYLAQYAPGSPSPRDTGVYVAVEAVEGAESADERAPAAARKPKTQQGGRRRAAAPESEG